jgi:membrane protease YdiL (CAAX protease family)
LKPAPQKFTPAILIPIATGLAAPFLEEPFFRGQLSKESKYQMLLANAVVFGAMHGLMKGSPELRIARVFMSTIGGLYYCAAQSITGDLWAPTIAHLMNNAFSLADALTKS